MKIIITGAAGFLGQKLTKALLNTSSLLSFNELVLVDVISIPNCIKDPRVQCVTVDLGDPKIAEQLIDSKCDIIFHLAAIVSGHAESDFNIGMKVNFDFTRQLLEAVRHNNPSIKFIFSSTCGVFGGNLPDIINDNTSVTPENSYGMEKALCELLINDYSRKGFLDGRIVRLPTITVRPGQPNKAVTSFASGIVREPLNNQEVVIPVSKDLPIWVSSPTTVIKNIIHAAIIQAKDLGSWRVVNLPGITVTVREMAETLCKVAGNDVASLIKFEEDDTINKIVVTFPRSFDTTRALKLGFTIDSNFENIIRLYIQEDLKKSCDKI